MPDLDLTMLSENLRSAEDGLTLPPMRVSDYVLENIYKPLLEDEPIALCDLDFAAFGDGDLNDLENFLESMQQTQNILQGVNKVFAVAEPVSLRRRAFC